MSRIRLVLGFTCLFTVAVILRTTSNRPAQESDCWIVGAFVIGVLAFALPEK